jgi:hypothetical protein
MRISEVVRSLCAGCVVYAVTLACSSAGGDDGNVAGTDTGGVTGMNGNGGSSGGAMGSGSVANAATGGGGSGACECPELPEPEPPVEVTVDCAANYMTQLWAELTIPGVKASDIPRIGFFTFYSDGDDITGTPGGYKSAVSGPIAHKVDTIAVQCWGNRATFVLPADLAELIP